MTIFRSAQADPVAAPVDHSAYFEPDLDARAPPWPPDVKEPFQEDRLHIIGLKHSWVHGRVTIERPAEPFAGFGASPLLEIGAFTYSTSHITPHVASVGRYCSIARGIQFGHEEHPTSWLSTSSFGYDPAFMGPGESQPLPDVLYEARRLPASITSRRIVIGNDVWIGFKAYIRTGIRLGDGCVVGAHAVVTRDVPPYAIVGGNPARIIRYRFDKGVINALRDLQWWRYDFTQFRDLDPSDVRGAIARMQALIAGGMQPYEPIPVVYEAREKPRSIDRATLVQD